MNFLQYLINGLSFGSIYALIAVSFVIVFRGTKVLNFAQGEFMIFGNYIAVMFMISAGVPFIPAFFISLVANTLLGILLEWSIFRRFIGESAFTVVMVTIGLASVLKGLVGLLWGHDMIKMPLPFENHVLSIGGINITILDIMIISLTFITLLALIFFYKKTKWGIAMRASASDQDTSQLMGIGINSVNRLTWSISAVISVVAGFALASNSFLQPTQATFALKAFPAIVLGGLDSIPGAVIGGLTLGVLESMAGGYLGPILGGNVKDVTAYVFLLLILIILPYGLFGTKEIERV